MIGTRHPVAVITGATSGIGCAVSLALGRRGYAIANVGRSEDALRSLKEKLGAAVPAAGYRLDLTEDGALRDLARHIARDFGRLDVLVHSADG